jgi:hypothetical protein
VDTSIHGYGGELSVAPGSNVHEEFQQDFFQACEAIGIDRVADAQDFKTSNAVGVSWPESIDSFLSKANISYSQRNGTVGSTRTMDSVRMSLVGFYIPFWMRTIQAYKLPQK